VAVVKILFSGKESLDEQKAIPILVVVEPKRRWSLPVNWPG
jgi:hypothetical protein